MRQCICQICTCGRHRCEHTSKRRVPFAKDKDDANKITEHKDRYRHFGYQPRDAPIKPASGADWKGTEPPVKLSTTKRDYVPLPIEKRDAMRPKVQREPKGKMSSSTTYKHDYKPKQGDRPNIIKRKEGTKDGTMPGTTPGKMEGETTYGRSFTHKEGTKREPAKVKACTLTQLGQPFKGVTETALSYQPHPYLKREMVLPKRGELMPEGDFEGNTTHKIDFTPKYQPPPKPIKKISKWKPGSEKFEGETTHAHDYKCPPQQPKPELVIPEGSLQTAPGPFEGVSHYKRDFPAHEITARSLPKWHPSLQKRKSEDAPMSGRTTYKTDYEAPPEDLPPPTSQRKPIKNNITIPSGAMEKATTTMRDYQKIDHPILSKSCRPDTHYQKPEGKFADCTTTRCDYTPKTAEKSEKSKREDNLGVAPGLMEDLSTTMRDFQGMCLDCPAKYLKLFGKEALPQYRFEKTEKGHDFFKKLKKPKD
ncbi:hypothetical protein AVEN_21101-1 [Araneus ventricosus]|uniref:Stabilizer of axonemal microtubules 2 n=1 Tax=Araneus ventricosus TaxID=182803 RepID=A0A4Y2FIG9_ARAVE|nr:hypothetical protein AVEN_21101-1 [Araneus ventricosus]